MSFSFHFSGHAASAEAERKILDVVHKLWETIKEHTDSQPNANVNTAFHGSGTPDMLSNAPASGGSTEATALAPDSYSSASESLAQGDPESEGTPKVPPTVDSAATSTPESQRTGNQS